MVLPRSITEELRLLREALHDITIIIQHPMQYRDMRWDKLKNDVVRNMNVARAKRDSAEYPENMMAEGEYEALRGVYIAIHALMNDGRGKL
jgi:hypothetical protein